MHIQDRALRLAAAAALVTAVASIALAFALHRAAAAVGTQTRAPAASKSAAKVETIARGLANPWSLQFLPDGRMLVTERPGRLRIVTREGRLSASVTGVPEVAAVGQGGLLDIALAPDFATSGIIVLAFAEPREGGGNGTSVARARLVLDAAGSGTLADLRVIFRQQPNGSGGLHFGCRLAFARDGSLFVALGERYQMQRAQDLTTHYGKIVRITLDGAVPPGNPFAGHATARPEIWSYGHRNLQSAAIHPVTGKLWTVEHGPRGGDEINVPLPGRNYGWPVITYGIDYSGTKIGVGKAKEGMEQPIYYWAPSIAPSGMAFYTGDLVPAWKGSLFVGALAGTALHRLVLDGETVVGEEVLLADLGERIRDVRQGPDGALWLLTDHGDGRILRLSGH